MLFIWDDLLKLFVLFWIGVVDLVSKIFGLDHNTASALTLWVIFIDICSIPLIYKIFAFKIEENEELS